MLSWKNWKHPERRSKIKCFIDKYNWEGINSPLEKDLWKKFEKNNPMVTLNVLYAIFCLRFKTYLKTWKTSILLMISNGERWYYLHY